MALPSISSFFLILLLFSPIFPFNFLAKDDDTSTLSSQQEPRNNLVAEIWGGTSCYEIDFLSVKYAVLQSYFCYTLLNDHENNKYEKIWQVHFYFNF